MGDTTIFPPPLLFPAVYAVGGSLSRDLLLDGREEKRELDTSE